MTFSRRTLLAAVLAAGLTFPPAAFADPAVTPIDVAHSRAEFSVQHLFISRVRGSVPIVAGSVTLGDDGPSAVEATLDPKGLATDDRDRDNDLQGPDWFDTKNFPTWEFKSTRVVPGKDGAFSLEGNLTIHGVTQPIVLQVTTLRTAPHPAYRAVGHVDRHAFGMKVTRSDGLIGTDVQLTLDVQLD